MKIVVPTIFPELISSFVDHGMVRVARERGALDVQALDIRAYADDAYRSVDDQPYGGGPGMVMSPVPLGKAVTAARDRLGGRGSVLLLSAQGRVLDQPLVRELSTAPALVLVCGRYKGVDERFCQRYVDLEVSLGDFVLSGGEVAAMALIEAVARTLPGVLGNQESAESDSFTSGLLEGPVYTRPPSFEGLEVPAVLTSGHHGRIQVWRRRQALERTLARRPDLLEHVTLDEDERDWLARRRRGVRANGDQPKGPVSAGSVD